MDLLDENVYLINLPCFCVVLVQVVHKNPIDLERNNMPTGRVKIFTDKCCLSSVERYRRWSPAAKDIDTVPNSCLRYELNNWVANVGKCVAFLTEKTCAWPNLGDGGLPFTSSTTHLGMITIRATTITLHWGWKLLWLWSWGWGLLELRWGHVQDIKITWNWGSCCVLPCKAFTSIIIYDGWIWFCIFNSVWWHLPPNM